MILSSKRSIFFVILWLSFSNSNLKQSNLVPNSGFELMRINYCGFFPTAEKFNEANDYWESPTRTRPQIYSSKIDSSCWNFASKLLLQSNTSSSVASILMFDQNNFRSYLQIQLKQKLKKGATYRTNIMVRLWPKTNLYCNNLGFYFSDTVIKKQDYSFINVMPQINHSMILRDTTDWFFLQKDFVATTDASYLTIGNFFDNANTEIDSVSNENIRNHNAVFIFIDNVSVYELGN